MNINHQRKKTKKINQCLSIMKISKNIVPILYKDKDLIYSYQLLNIYEIN